MSDEPFIRNIVAMALVVSDMIFYFLCVCVVIERICFVDEKREMIIVLMSYIAIVIFELSIRHFYTRDSIHMHHYFAMICRAT